jgi:hypothetical protein
VYQIQNLTGDSKQKQTLVLPDGSQIQIQIYFVPMQYGWFISSLVYRDFTLTNLRITNSPNMLYQFRNRIPFGLACFSSQDREPSQQLDFVSGASKLYVLTEAEVEQYTEYLSGQI